MPKLNLVCAIRDVMCDFFFLRFRPILRAETYLYFGLGLNLGKTT